MKVTFKPLFLVISIIALLTINFIILSTANAQKLTGMEARANTERAEQAAREAWANANAASELALDLRRTANRTGDSGDIERARQADELARSAIESAQEAQKNAQIVRRAEIEMVQARADGNDTMLEQFSIISNEDTASARRNADNASNARQGIEQLGPGTTGNGGGGGATQLEQPIGRLKQADFVTYIQALFAFGLQIIVLTAAIFIVIGSYAYFAAGGNAAMAEKGKEIITRTIIGLLLALVGWIILNTISPQFANDLQAPKLEQTK